MTKLLIFFENHFKNTISKSSLINKLMLLANFSIRAAPWHTHTWNSRRNMKLCLYSMAKRIQWNHRMYLARNLTQSNKLWFQREMVLFLVMKEGYSTSSLHHLVIKTEIPFYHTEIRLIFKKFATNYLNRSITYYSTLRVYSPNPVN